MCDNNNVTSNKGGGDDITSPNLQIDYPFFYFLRHHGAKIHYGSSSQLLCGPVPTSKRKSLKIVDNERLLLGILNTNPVGDVFVCFELDSLHNHLMVLEVPRDNRMDRFVENANASSILNDDQRSTFFVRTKTSVLFFFLNGGFKQKRLNVVSTSGILVHYYPRGFFTVWGDKDFQIFVTNPQGNGETDQLSLNPVPPYLSPTKMSEPFFHKGRFKLDLTPNNFFDPLGLPADYKGDLRQLDENKALLLQQIFMLYCNHYPYISDYPPVILDIMDKQSKGLLKEGRDEGYDTPYPSSSDEEEEGEGETETEKATGSKLRSRPSREAMQQQAKAEYHLTARLYRSLFGDKWRFHPEQENWYEWTGSYWKKTKGKTFFNQFKKVNMDYVSNRVFLGGSIATMLSAIHTRFPIAQDVLSFQAPTPPLGVNFLNGFFDASTLTFHKDRSELPLFHVCDAHWSPTLPSKELLDKLGSLIEYNETGFFILRSLLYRLINPVSALQTIVCLTGLTDTGKTVMSKTCVNLVGEAHTSHPDISRFSGKFMAAEYIDKKLVVVTETDSISSAADNHFRKIGESQMVEIKGQQETFTASFGGVFLILTNKSPTELTKVSMALRARMISVEFIKHGTAIDTTLESFFVSHLGELVNWALAMPKEQLLSLVRAHEFVQGTGLDTTATGRFVCRHLKLEKDSLLRMSTCRQLYREDREELSLVQHLGDDELERELKQYGRSVLGAEITGERTYVLSIAETFAHLEKRGVDTSDLNDWNAPVIRCKRNTPGAQRVRCVSGYRLIVHGESTLLDEIEAKAIGMNPWEWDKNSPLYSKWKEQNFQESAKEVVLAGRNKFGLSHMESHNDEPEIDKPEGDQVDDSAPEKGA